MSETRPRTAAELIADLIQRCDKAIAAGEFDFHEYLRVLGPRQALPLLQELAALRSAPPVAPEWQPIELTDALILQLREEAERAERRAFLDAAEIDCTHRQAAEIGRSAYYETVRSFLYQAGVLPPAPTKGAAR